MTRRPGLKSTHREKGMKNAGALAAHSASDRMTAGFEDVSALMAQ